MVSVENLALRLGGKMLFQEANLSFFKGRRYGLTGSNGSGKSSFLKVLSGEIEPLKGHLSIPKEATLSTLEQDHYLFEDIKIIEVVIQGKKALWEALEKKEKLLSQLSFNDSDGMILAQLEELIQKYDGYTAKSVAGKILEGLGIEEKFHESKLSTLSGGYKLRVLLAKTIFSNPDILILDEPTNHLDIFSIKWLALYLKGFEGILIFTSHDKDFLNQVSTDIIDIDLGSIWHYRGNYDEAVLKKREEILLAKKKIDAISDEQEKLMGFYERFGAKATKAAQAQAKLKQAEKLEEQKESLILKGSTRRGLNLSFPICRPSAYIPLKVKAVSKSYKDKEVLKNVSFEVERGQKIAIVGPNGVGKSSLLEIITSNLSQDFGSFEFAPNSFFAYFPQEVAKHMDEQLSPLEWLSQFDRQAKEETLRAILAKVLFQKDEATEKKLIHLSGGELSRLVLAKLMLLDQNILILDEPTNHLDLEAIDSLIEALKNYEGTLIFVSHNSSFVSSLATRIIEIREGSIKNFQGSFEEYLAQSSYQLLSHEVPVSHRYHKEYHLGGNSSVCNEKVSETQAWEDRKKQQNLKKQNEKTCKALEEKWMLLESELHSLSHLIASSEFYEKYNRKEQDSYFAKKKELESLVENIIKDLERLSNEYT